MLTTLRVLSLLTIAALGAEGRPAPRGAEGNPAPPGAEANTALLGAQAKSAEPIELTQVEVERRVKDDMARRVRLRADDVRIVESGARVWPDAGLGCNARRGVFEERQGVPGGGEERRQGVPGGTEPTRVPGFEIVAEAGGQRFVYHTDRRGQLRRCSTPRKPIDRIQ
jgi:hypothetical protein